MTKKKVSQKSKIPRATSKPEPQTMEELLAQTGYTLRGLKRGTIVEGILTRISPSEVLIDIGGKSEGIVLGRELGTIKDLLQNLTVGDKVSAYVISPEDNNGQVVLSLRRAGIDFKWKKIKESQNLKKAVSARVLESHSSGLIVEVEGLRGFIPSSQLDISHLAKGRELINKIIQTKIIEADQKTNRLILSEKAALLETTAAERKKTLAKIKIGETYEGVICGVMPFGVFVNVEGVEGLVHISEISWEKVTNPHQYFNIGDKVSVLLLGIDETAGKLNLSLKQLVSDPWAEAAKHFRHDQKVLGIVSKVADFGVFVKLEPGIEGLIHITKIPPERQLKVEEEVECLIEAVNLEQRKISLSLVLKEKPAVYK